MTAAPIDNPPSDVAQALEAVCRCATNLPIWTGPDYLVCLYCDKQTSAPRVDALLAARLRGIFAAVEDGSVSAHGPDQTVGADECLSTSRVQT